MHIVYVVFATLWCLGFVGWLGFIVYAVIKAWIKNRSYKQKYKDHIN